MSAGNRFKVELIWPPFWADSLSAQIQAGQGLAAMRICRLVTSALESELTR